PPRGRDEPSIEGPHLSERDVGDVLDDVQQGHARAALGRQHERQPERPRVLVAQVDGYQDVLEHTHLSSNSPVVGATAPGVSTYSPSPKKHAVTRVGREG